MQPFLEIKNVDFRVPGRELPILENINLSLNAGDFLILLGGNGSGKSSLLKMMNQTYVPTQGGVKTHVENSHIFTLTQKPNESLFMQLTVFENVLLREMQTPRSKRKFRVEIAEYLKNFNPRLSDALDMPVLHLSGGELQVLMLALCMRHQPKLLLLDEHTSALDPNTAEKVMQFTKELIERERLTCVMTTHNLEFAMRFGNRVVAMHQGKIIYKANAQDKSKMTTETLLHACYAPH